MGVTEQGPCTKAFFREDDSPVRDSRASPPVTRKGISSASPCSERCLQAPHRSDVRRDMRNAGLHPSQGRPGQLSRSLEIGDVLSKPEKAEGRFRALQRRSG